VRLKSNFFDSTISFFFFLAIFLLPYSLRAFFQVSLSNGTFVSLLIFLISTLVARNFKLLGKFDSSFFKIIAISGLLIALHSIICTIFFQNDLIRLLLSFVFLIFLSYCAFSFQKYYTVKIFYIKFTLLILIFIFILSRIFIKYIQSKSVIFFSEPSHFALVFIPFLFVLLVISKNSVKFFLMLISFVIAAYIENLTFMCGLALCLLLIIPFRTLFYVVPSFILAILTIRYSQIYYGYEGLSYYFDRLPLSVDSFNLSSMVYLVGWDRAIADVIASFGFGIGFQQFGIAGPESMLSELVIKRFHLPGPLNLLDGGSLGAKFVGEFGIFGVLLLFCYLFYFIKFIKILNISNYSTHRLSIQSVFFMSWFITFSIDIFVRGTGYFNPPFLIFLASIFYLFPLTPVKTMLNKL